jgi:NitT/TauT family transport system substrate-binding protein
MPHLRPLLVSTLLLFVAFREPSALGAPVPKLTLYTHWFAQPEDGGFYAALLKGYWKEEGIDVTIEQGGANANVEKRITLNRMSFGITPAEQIVQGVAHGLPLVSVMNFFQHDPQALMVHEESRVKSFEDLDGQTIAAVTGAVYFQFLAQKYHLIHAKVVPYNGAIAPFLKDPGLAQQAFPTSEPYFAAKAGVRTRILMVHESGFDPYRVVATHTDLAKEHPEWVRAFARGAYRGWLEFAKNPGPALDEICKVSPMNDRDASDFAYRKIRELRFLEGFADRGESFGGSQATRWTNLVGQLASLKIIPASVQAEKVYSAAWTPEKVGISQEEIARGLGESPGH